MKISGDRYLIGFRSGGDFIVITSAGSRAGAMRKAQSMASAQKRSMFIYRVSFTDSGKVLYNE